MEGNIQMAWRIFSEHKFPRPHSGSIDPEFLVMGLRMSLGAQCVFRIWRQLENQGVLGQRRGIFARVTRRWVGRNRPEIQRLGFQRRWKGEGEKGGNTGGLKGSRRRGPPLAGRKKA